ncbi:MAG TPA: hypothetical protein VN540_10700 [Clostridia bacterium]|nr:hypothetical protein [Clostridia bacterium]
METIRKPIGKPFPARLAFYFTNALAVVFIVALCYFFLVLGNSLLSGLGKEIVHYDAQGRPYTTSLNGVGEGAWIAMFAWYLFILVKVAAVGFLLELLKKVFPKLGGSLLAGKNDRHRFRDLIDARTTGADAGAWMLATVALTGAGVYALAYRLMLHGLPLYAGTRYSIVFFLMNAGDVTAVSAFMLSFFTLRRSWKSILAFLVSLGCAVSCHTYTLMRTFQWLRAGLPGFDPIPVYCVTFALIALLLFFVVTLGKKRNLMGLACAVLSILLYVYYKLLHGYGLLELDVAYLTGVLAGPVTLIWCTRQLHDRLHLKVD